MASTHEISRIILKARRLKKIKQEALSSMVGCSRSYISKLEKGAVLLSHGLALKLEPALGLKNGRLSSILKNIKFKERLLKEDARQAVYGVRAGDTKFLLSDNKILPLYTLNSSLWTEKLDRYIAVPSDQMNGHKAFFVKSYDNSMDRAGIAKGDILLVEIHKPKTDDICVYCIQEQYFVRRYKKIDGRIVMSSESTDKKFKEQTFKDDGNVVMKGVAGFVYLTKTKKKALPRHLTA